MRSPVREHGPLTSGEWTDLLIGEGWDWEADSFALDLPEPYVVEFPDGRTVVMDRIYGAVVVTCSVTADEIASDILVATPDLTALTILRPNPPMELPALGTPR